MKKYARRALLLAAFGLFSTGAAFAEDPEGSVWLWFRPSWTYAGLGMVNDMIEAGNAIFEQRGLATVDDFHNTFSVGVDLQVALGERLTAYGGYDRVFGKQSRSFDRVIELSTTGTAANGGLMFRLPWPKRWQESLDDLDVFVGGGAIYVPDFKFKASDEELTPSREFLEERTFTGEGLGAELRLNAEYFLTHKFTLMFGFGYRFLKLNDLEHEARVYNPNAFNPEGNDDADEERRLGEPLLENQADPDYIDNQRRMYGERRFNQDLGEWEHIKPDDRYLEPFYIYDPKSYANVEGFSVYDKDASFDADMSGFQVRVGLTYYIF